MAMSGWKGTSDTISVCSDAVSDISIIKIREGASYLWVSLENAAHKEFQAFQLQGQPTSDADWTTMADDARHFSPVELSDVHTSPVEWASVSPVTLAASTTCLFKTHVKGLYAVKLRGQSASGSDTTVDLRWSVR